MRRVWKYFTRNTWRTKTHPTVASVGRNTSLYPATLLENPPTAGSRRRSVFFLKWLRPNNFHDSRATFTPRRVFPPSRCFLRLVFTYRYIYIFYGTLPCIYAILARFLNRANKKSHTFRGSINIPRLFTIVRTLLYLSLFYSFVYACVCPRLRDYFSILLSTGSVYREQKTNYAAIL